MFVRMIAYPDVIRVAVRVNPPSAWHDHISAHMSTVGDTHKTDEGLFAKLAAKNRDRVLTKPNRYVPDRFRSITTVSTTAVITTRHPQCPVVTPVGTEDTNTVAVIAKADGKRTPSAVSTPQRPLATGATRTSISYSMYALQRRNMIIFFEVL